MYIITDKYDDSVIFTPDELIYDTSKFILKNNSRIEISQINIYQIEEFPLEIKAYYYDGNFQDIPKKKFRKLNPKKLKLDELVDLLINKKIITQDEINDI